MMDATKKAPIPTMWAKKFHSNLNKLEYFNPANYPITPENCDRAKELHRDFRYELDNSIQHAYWTVKKEAVGYDVVPLELVNKDHLKPELREHLNHFYACNSFGVKRKDADFYSAIITWSKELNSLGTGTVRYWLISPFITKERAISNPPYPISLTSRTAIRSNDIKRVLTELLRYPPIYFETVVDWRFSQYENAGKAVLGADLKQLNSKVDDFIDNLHCGQAHKYKNTTKETLYRNRRLLASWIAAVATGQSTEDIPVIDGLAERAQTFLADSKSLHEDIEQAESLTPVFVSQLGNNDVFRCFTVAKPESYIDAKGYIYCVEGSIDKSLMCSTPDELPYAIKSKLAALQINEPNMREAVYEGYKYIPNMGAFMEYKFLSIGGKHAMVFLNPTEFAEVFPSE
jgi:hypothetical protein